MYDSKAVEGKSVCSEVLSRLFCVVAYINGWIPTITIIKPILKKSELNKNFNTCKSYFPAYLNYKDLSLPS